MEKIELLSPCGDFECLKSAVQNGADSVYLGASSFSARAKATNFDSNELLEAIRYAKLRNVKVHLALNTLIKNNEMQSAIDLAVSAYNMGVDAIIIQDLGLADFLIRNYPEIPLHASTQMTVHNLVGCKQLENLGYKRVVLARELSISEIEYIRKNTSIELEVFIHGALCISYSGQCLLSSMIGGRSGNRGLCAQPCRLPYELIEENKNTHVQSSLDKGYLLSPRDNLGIEYLPELIKMGVDSLKIEGRMKTPTYVGVVTRIYRKYIDYVYDNLDLDNDTLRKNIINMMDIVNESTGLSDKQEITQVFNRGGFSAGHFSSNPNRELIFKEKPNNMGVYLGIIEHINENKGHLKLKLEDSLSIGDKIQINNESYTVSELMINNKNFDTLDKGSLVTIGRMKGKISVGNKIYRIESAKLNKSISPTFAENKNFKKIILNGEISLKEHKPISFKVWSDDGFYKNISYTAISSIPQKALNQPLTTEKIKEQLRKTGNTEFEFKEINVELDNDLFVQMGILNDLRRTALDDLREKVLRAYTRDLKTINLQELSKIKSISSEKKICLLLNKIDENANYLELKNIDKLYIPISYFLNKKYHSKILNICDTYKTYVYLPIVLRDEFLSTIDFNSLVKEFKINGFVISNISQIESLKNLGLELIGNYNLNIYNNFSVEKLSKLDLSTITISPELDKFETNEVLEKSTLSTEIIIYGKLPVMTNRYCYLGKSNKCYKECSRKCLENNNYYLSDRMNFKFEFVPDNLQTITTIYNSKILSAYSKDFMCDSVRIDILDENIDEIQNIINLVKSNKRVEGIDFTNGKY